jgi:2-polyprenyl-6-hydroxyphenyl methylase/3-demethylubiquinone-9 3-methyltransferase
MSSKTRHAPPEALSSSRESSIAYHGQLAAGWDQRYARGGFRRRADFFRAVVLPRLDLRGDWLDLGCGSGYFSRLLCTAGAKISGVDGSPEMIRMARALGLARADTAAIPFLTMALTELIDIPTARLDGVLCLSVLEYLENPEAGFAEIVRIVKPGGQLVMSAPNRHSAVRRWQKTKRRLSSRQIAGYEDYLRFSRWDTSDYHLRSLAAEHELTSVEILPFDPVLPRTVLHLLPASLLYLVARKRAN